MSGQDSIAGGPQADSREYQKKAQDIACNEYIDEKKDLRRRHY